MKTGILTDPYGNPLSGGSAAAPAIDANHLYVYDCSEPAGSTILKNTGSGVNGDLTLYGTENTDYILASKKQGKNIKSYRSIVSGGSGSAYSGTSCSITGGSFSAEMLLSLDTDGVTQTNGNVLWAESAGGADSFYIYCAYNGNTPYISFSSIPGTFATSPAVNISQFCLRPFYYLVTYNAATGILQTYIDGLAVGSIAVTGGAHSMPTITRIGFNGYPGSSNSVRGWYTQVRFSNIVRSASYALATASTLLAM